MKKLNLSLDALRVESFHTDVAAAARGTVNGHEPTFDRLCYTQDPSACDGSCVASCAGTCQVSCGGASCDVFSCNPDDSCAYYTCYQGCTYPSGIDNPCG